MPARWPRPIRRSLRSRLSFIDYLAEAQLLPKRQRPSARPPKRPAGCRGSCACRFQVCRLLRAGTALHESETLTGHAREDYAKVIEDAKAAIEAAKTPEEVTAVLNAAREGSQDRRLPEHELHRRGGKRLVSHRRRLHGEKRLHERRCGRCVRRRRQPDPRPARDDPLSHRGRAGEHGHEPALPTWRTVSGTRTLSSGQRRTASSRA